MHDRTFPRAPGHRISSVPSRTGKSHRVCVSWHVRIDVAICEVLKKPVVFSSDRFNRCVSRCLRRLRSRRRRSGCGMLSRCLPTAIGMRERSRSTVELLASYCEDVRVSTGGDESKSPHDPPKMEFYGCS